jgi:hypothetical protein
MTKVLFGTSDLRYMNTLVIHCLPCSEVTMEEVQSRHKKELKALDGEKRSAIKKAKALKGKKGKDALERLAKFC